jgi:2-C-methyl-D-erythritol 4-phosphate cytidylyltransferase
LAVALLVAAGSGERLGAGRPKAFVKLAGIPLLRWALDALAAAPAIAEIVVALPPGLDPEPALAGAFPGAVKEAPAGAPAAAPARAPAEAAADALAGARAVAGGASRSESVRNALAVAPPGDPVIVHDAARPLVSAALIERVLAALDQPMAGGSLPAAAVAAAPVTDTIKRVRPPGREVAETLERRALWAVQTPQAFRRAALQRALDVPAEVLAQASDDAWLIERAGGGVVVVPSDAANPKITTPLDLAVAEALVGALAGA